jgi:predicted PhzF superfamily epimerase YddE/YHI9
MGRRSKIGVHVKLDGEGKKVVGVRLSGCAVVVMEGCLRIWWW